MADYAPGTEQQFEQQTQQSIPEMTQQNISEQHVGNEGQFQQRGPRGNRPGDKIFGSKDEDDETKIFVGGLNYSTDQKALEAYFSKYGDIEDTIVKTDDYGKSRCFGFVKFTDAGSSKEVLDKGPHIIDHKQVDCKVARRQPKPDFLKVKKLFVGGLSNSTTEKVLKDYFGSLGTIVSFDQPSDPNDPKKKRGFCFITFDSEDAVNEAMKSQFHFIGEEQARVEVKRAQHKGDKDQQGGFGFQGQQRSAPGQTGYWGAYQGQGGYDQNAYSQQQYNQYAQNYYQQYPNQYPGYYGQQQQQPYYNYDQSSYYNHYNQQSAAGSGGYNYSQGYDYSQASYPGYTTGTE